MNVLSPLKPTEGFSGLTGNLALDVPPRPHSCNSHRAGEHACACESSHVFVGSVLWEWGARGQTQGGRNVGCRHVRGGCGPKHVGARRGEGQRKGRGRHTLSH